MMETDELEKYKLKYLKEVVQESFPFIQYFGSSSSTHQEGYGSTIAFQNPKSFTGDINPYSFQKEISFIHYTSLEAAFNILRDEYFRLHNLIDLDDVQELIYGADVLEGNWEDKDVQNLKKRIFSISMCEFTDNSCENFDSWRLYGNNGHGIGIVFRFKKPITDFGAYHLSKIYYGRQFDKSNNIDGNLEAFQKLRINHNTFIASLPNHVKLLNNSFGEVGKIPDWIAIFLSFHKNGFYKTENEIRLLKFKNLNDYFVGEADYILNKKYNLSKFEKLVINIDPSKTFEVDMESLNHPVVEIQKIITGYRLKNYFPNLQTAFKDFLSEKNNYRISIEASRFEQYF